MISVSVIIPIFNVENYLDECLKSIINQTLKNIEIICINDGSTDCSSEIIKKYRNEDSRIVSIYQSNKGLSFARNVGLKIAKGEYVYFIDSDDFLELNALEELYLYAKKHDLDIIYFNAKCIFSSYELEKKFENYKHYYNRNKDYNLIISGKEMFMEMTENNDYRVHACLQMLKLKFLLENEFIFYEGIYYEDNLFSLKCILYAKYVGYLNKFFYIRRLRENSIITVKRSYKHLYSYFIVILNMIYFISINKFDEKLQVKIINEIDKLYNEEMFIYNNLSEEEKEKINNFSAIDKYLFNLIIVQKEINNKMAIELNLIKNNKINKIISNIRKYMKIFKIN